MVLFSNSQIPGIFPRNHVLLLLPDVEVLQQRPDSRYFVAQKLAFGLRQNEIMLVDFVIRLLFILKLSLELHIQGVGQTYFQIEKNAVRINFYGVFAVWTMSNTGKLSVIVNFFNEISLEDFELNEVTIKNKSNKVSYCIYTITLLLKFI